MDGNGNQAKDDTGENANCDRDKNIIAYERAGARENCVHKKKYVLPIHTQVLYYKHA